SLMNSVAPPRVQFETFNSRGEGSTRVRTAWISDVHLGTRASGAARLLDFLREYDFERLYIVGDLIDIWQMRRSRYWPQQHNDVIQKILRKSRNGRRVLVIHGHELDTVVQNVKWLAFLGDGWLPVPALAQSVNQFLPPSFRPRL